MIIYWLFLVLSLTVDSSFRRRYYLVDFGNTIEKRAKRSCGLLFFTVVCLFCGLRSGIADTGTYINMFYAYPDNLSDAIAVLDTVKDEGFYLLSVLYKQWISSDFHGWLFIIAFVSCYATLVAFRKYSSEFGLSCFLFIATTTFTYLINGMRQYIVISIILACSSWIVDRKYFKFILLILLLSTIHGSAIIFIPLLFLVNAKPWSWRMWVAVAAAVFLGLNSSAFMTVVETSLSDTQYENYVDYIANSGVGSNIMRLFLALVPVILAYMEKDIIDNLGTPFVKLCVNMSVINFCVYFIATFTSGMALGRVAAYFDVYNLILLPWLITHYPSFSMRQFLKKSMIVLYIVFFWFQMDVTWNIPYESDIFRLYLY